MAGFFPFRNFRRKEPVLPELGHKDDGTTVGSFAIELYLPDPPFKYRVTGS